MQKKTKYIIKISIIIFFALIIANCARHKQHPKQTNPNFNEITFGSSGGFTGIEKQYVLKSNGEVYKIAGDSVLLNQITESKIDSISNFIQKISFQNIVSNETGNITYSIEVKTNTFTKKATWNDQSQVNDLKEFYKILVKTLKR